MFQADRIDELTRSLVEVRGAGKRQAAPFSKGAAKPEAKRPGRKAGEAHGRHGHGASRIANRAGHSMSRFRRAARTAAGDTSAVATGSEKLDARLRFSQ